MPDLKSNASRLGRAAAASRARRFDVAVAARALVRWYRTHARDLPWRRTRDPYAVWISEVMLQQTQVRTVIPYYERWLRTLPTVEALASADEPRVLKLWEGLGYYSRARNLQRAAREIVDRFEGRLPQSVEDLLTLPGVGPYTAGAIASIAFDQAAPILDGNVIRVLCRWRGIDRDPASRQVREELWRLAREWVESADRMPRRGRRSAAARVPGARGEKRTKRTHGARPCSDLNQALMELGATVCTPVNPECPRCPLRSSCVARREARIEDLPRPRRRPAAVRRRFVAWVAVRAGRCLIRRRPSDSVNAGLWEFPNVEVEPGESAARGVARAAPGTRLRSDQPILVIRHSITRYRIQLEAYLAVASTADAAPGCVWRGVASLDKLPFTGAHRKLADWLSAEPDAREGTSPPR